jgi:hypothetical protein
MTSNRDHRHGGARRPDAILPADADWSAPPGQRGCQTGKGNARRQVPAAVISKSASIAHAFGAEAQKRRVQDRGTTIRSLRLQDVFSPQRQPVASALFDPRNVFLILF